MLLVDQHEEDVVARRHRGARRRWRLSGRRCRRRACAWAIPPAISVEPSRAAPDVIAARRDGLDESSSGFDILLLLLHEQKRDATRSCTRSKATVYLMSRSA